MTEGYRSAKADVKAEKARAKAMRPWWKKKRIIIPLVVVAFAVIAAVSAGGGSDTDNTSSNSADAGDSGSNFSNNDEHKPVDDVEVTGCKKTVIDTVEVALKVTNNSSKESDYSITLSIEDAAGNKIGDGFASTSNVNPGQVSTTDGVATLSDADSDADFSCVVEDVERFAS